MSEEVLERIYTINLGKVLLSPNNQRAKRAINMIREFASRHMKSENVKIEEDVNHLVWERGIRHPPRKIRVKITKDDDGNIIVSEYQEEKKVEEKPKEKKEEKKVEEKPKEKKKKEEKKVEEKPKEKKEEKKVEEKPKEKKEEKKISSSKSGKKQKKE
ncbi:MAG: 50S ribosomal protein L31e [Thaumarchaeota archaeon]|nr:MAG: 50S ribosomal protein L31e [Nitrososphaerota archaeon]